MKNMYFNSQMLIRKHLVHMLYILETKNCMVFLQNELFADDSMYDRLAGSDKHRRFLMICPFAMASQINKIYFFRVVQLTYGLR